MTKHSSAIRKAIQTLSNHMGGNNGGIFMATVNSVDLENRTCTVSAIDDVETTEYPDVLLQADVDNGLLIIPAIGSTVVVTYNTRGYAYISMFSAVDSAQMVAPNGFTFNDGAYGGLIKIAELVDRINRIEQKLNTHVHPGVQSGGSSTGAISSPITPLTTRDDLENTKIQHG